MSSAVFCFRVSQDSNFASLVAGVLVESGTPVENTLKGERHFFFFLINLKYCWGG